MVKHQYVKGPSRLPDTSVWTCSECGHWIYSREDVTSLSSEILEYAGGCVAFIRSTVTERIKQLASGERGLRRAGLQSLIRVVNGVDE